MTIPHHTHVPGGPNSDAPSERDVTPQNRGRAGQALIDGDLARTRRLELHLSERKLAEMLGANFSQSVLRGLEAGTNHHDLTLGELRRLAALLDLPMGRLLAPAAATATIAATTAPATAAPRDVPAGPATWSAHLDAAVTATAAILIDLDRAFPVQAIADLLGHTLEETDTILDELDRRLAPAGLRVRQVHRLVSIRATEPGLTMSQRRNIWRRTLARRSLDSSQARILQRAQSGDLTKTASEDVRVRGSALVNAGILRRTPAGGFELTDEVTYSLARD